MRYAILLLVLGLPTGVLSQSTRSHKGQVTWGVGGASASVDTGVRLMPYGGCWAPDGSMPSISFKVPVGSPVQDVRLSVVNSVPMSRTEIESLKDLGGVEELDWEYSAVSQAGELYLVGSFSSIYMLNGQPMKVEEYLLEWEQARFAPVHRSGAKSTSVNSVLAPGSGSWVKMTIPTTGVYRLNKSDLENMGLDPSSIDPRDINIYGNGTGMLPVGNWEYRPDDLLKNRIVVYGESDGVFNDGDYVLFYANGPHRWAYDTANGVFNHVHNRYSDVAYYFLNVNPSESPLRVQSASVSPLAATDVVTSFDGLAYMEQDLVNPMRAGKHWFGDLFDLQLTRSYSFQFPNIITSEQARLRSCFANRSFTSGDQVVVSSGGSTLQTFGFGSLGSFLYANRSTQANMVSLTGSSVTIDVTYNKVASSSQLWIDFLEFNVRRQLNFPGGQMSFRDSRSIGTGKVAEFRVTGPSSFNVWDVTDPSQVQSVPLQDAGSYKWFKMASDSLREFIAIDGSAYLKPSSYESVGVQNIHAMPQPDLLIVAPEDFLAQANRLASLHQDLDGMVVNVVNIEKVYNEFSSGAKDATAIKMMAKMFYDRGRTDSTRQIKHLLLFGDGSYDHKDRVAGNNDWVPAVQGGDQVSMEYSFINDDYYGLLDSNESDRYYDLLDIGVGRLPVNSSSEAREAVDKIEHYMRNGSNLFVDQDFQCSSGDLTSTFGDWKNRITLVADDENGGQFVYDCQDMSALISGQRPEYNLKKIYLDAFQQVTTAGGHRYPQAQEQLVRSVQEGTFIFNYVGHGGETGLAEERILSIPDIESWTNIDALTIFVSATCEFARFDDPERKSAGEYVIGNPRGGAIAMMTTVRPIFIGFNETMNMNFYNGLFSQPQGDPIRFGEVVAYAKNSTLNNASQHRNFVLLGDPALKVAMPGYRIVTDSVNGVAVSAGADTIRALSHVEVKGHLEDFSGNALSTFNGTVTPSIYDKPRQTSTLANDGGPMIGFQLQDVILYRGKVSVKNGEFTVRCIAPKDLDYSYGNGKLSYYGENGVEDATGEETQVIVGGIDTTGIDDDQGPEVVLFLNDEQFADGGITDDSPMLVAEVFDESGVNTAGNGVGHDMVAILDRDQTNPIVLNSYYEADLDTYKSGKVQYLFSDLEEGPHHVKFKVFDVNNNSGEAELEFVVTSSEELALEHVLNYPNPFTTHTEFYFEHNQPCQDLDVRIQVFTVSGKLVKTLNQTVVCNGYRNEGIAWDGLDDYGDRLGKGVYVYLVEVTDPSGRKAEKYEKLVLLR